MPKIGYHASHELFSPADLLASAKRAQTLGYEAGMCSDHFYPWLESQGHSGFSWSWLGAALEGTTLTYGVVCCPFHRYHPAIVAQAAATLNVMYPGRFWLAIGSGEALNESITGLPWPDKPERQALLEEAAAIMRRLWAGETVTSDGRIKTREAFLFTRPAEPPMLFGAALSPQTAEFAGRWADGMITIAQSTEKMQAVISAFRKTGGGKPIVLQAALSYGASEEEARTAAHRYWRQAALPRVQLADLPTPWAFERAAAAVAPDAVCSCVRASSNLEQHLAWLVSDLEFGFDAIFLYDVGKHDFMEDFARKVLPELQARPGRLLAQTSGRDAPPESASVPPAS